MVAFVTTPASQVTTPHFAWPFQLGADRAFAVVEQDTSDDVTQNVLILVSTQVGSREELPEYGITDPTFSAVVDSEEIISAVTEWEERATVDIQQSLDSANEMIKNVTINIGDSGIGIRGAETHTRVAAGTLTAKQDPEIFGSDVYGSGDYGGGIY